MCCADQILQMVCLLHLRLSMHCIFRLAKHSATSQSLPFYRVELPPEGPVLTIILGGVEVAGHTPCLHLLKQVSPLRECPWSPVETLVKNIYSVMCQRLAQNLGSHLDNSTKERSCGVGVRLLRLTRARHCRSKGRYWSSNKLRKTIWVGSTHWVLK